MNEVRMGTSKSYILVGQKMNQKTMPRLPKAPGTAAMQNTYNYASIPHIPFNCRESQVNKNITDNIKS
jgi:hypothetical protein